MSHHSHINGHSAHVPTPHVKLGPNQYEGTKYTPQVDAKEGQTAGLIIGRLFKWFFKGTFWSIGYGGATALDTLRMKTPTAEFFSWKRVAALWLGLLSILLLATGVPGFYLMVLIGAILAFTPGGAFVLWAGTNLPIPTLNALLSIPIPAVGPRVELMELMLEPCGRGQELHTLSHASLGGAPLMEWYTRLDYASLLIPAFLTLVATLKYFRMSRARNFSNGDECEGRPWSAVERLWLVFAVSLVVFGLPGAPFGLWTVLSLLGWRVYGKTKNAVPLGYSEHRATSGATFDLSDLPAAPVPPAPGPAPTTAPTYPSQPLRDFEEEEHRRKAQPVRRTDYAE